MVRWLQSRTCAVFAVVTVLATGSAIGAPIAAVVPPALADESGDDLRINDVQAEGTHNSYHLRPKNLLALIPDLDYAESPLADQLTYEGVRQFEIDVNWSDNYWRFLTFHIWGIDTETTCFYFTTCLSQIEEWSDAHPDHHPITIMVEPKSELDFFNVNEKHYDDLDADVRSVFGEGDLIEPDDVRGMHTTLRDAVVTDGWPTLAESRGKVLLALLAEPHQRAAYLAGRPNLEGRPMFVTSESASADHAAFFKVDDPIAGTDEIRDLVEANFLVRTRSDSRPDPAYGYPARREAAFASGAQFVSTDFPAPGRIPNSDYFVALPGGNPSRCNPVTAPPTCDTADIENIPPVTTTYGVKIFMAGAHDYVNQGTIGDDKLFLGPRGKEPVGGVFGGGALEDPTSGSPAIRLNLRQLIPGFGILIGGIQIDDPDAGISWYLYTPIASTTRIGPNGISGSTFWVDPARFPWVSWLDWEIEAV